MKTVKYGNGIIEYDELASCKICGEPVHHASMGGTVICPSCDCGHCRFCGREHTIFVFKRDLDNSRSYNEIREHMKEWRTKLGLPEKYTEKQLIEAMYKFKEEKSKNSNGDKKCPFV